MKSLKLMIIVAAMTFTATASAQDIQSDACEFDSDCPAESVCETVLIEECPPCREGDECPCGGYEVNQCSGGQTPLPDCQADDDCSDGFVCVSYTSEVCSVSVEPCLDDGSPCNNSSGPEECTSETQTQCVPKYVAPCEVNDDCGVGFTCEESEACICTGTTTNSEPGPSDCSCAPTGTRYCELVDVDCTTDADCVGELLCQDVESPIVIPCEEGGPCNSVDEPVGSAKCEPANYPAWGGGQDGAERIANVTGGDISTIDRVAWGEGGDDAPLDKGKVGGCSATGKGRPVGALWLLALGIFGFVRRRR